MKKTLLLTTLLSLSQAHAADKLTVMLGWFVNPNHAEMVIAKQRGIFAKHDLDVDIIEPTDTSIAPRMAAADKVDLAVDSQPQLTMQISEGMPLMKVSTLLPNPVSTLLARKDSGITTMADFKGKTLGYSLPGFDTVLLNTMLKHAGLTPDEVKTVNINWAITQSLKAEKVAGVMGAYRIFEKFELEQDGIPTISFNPEDNGVPSYEEVILVANPKHANDPRFARFNAALKEALAYIRANPDDAWKEFIAYKKELNDPLNRAAWQAVIPLFADDPSENNPEKYQHFTQFMLDNGLIKQNISIPFYQSKN